MPGVIADVSLPGPRRRGSHTVETEETCARVFLRFEDTLREDGSTGTAMREQLADGHVFPACLFRCIEQIQFVKLEQEGGNLKGAAFFRRIRWLFSRR